MENKGRGVINNFTVYRPVRRVCGVSVTQTQNGLTADKPLQQDFGFHSRAELETAIQRSQNYLLREQKPEGYWVGELMVDSTIVSDTIAYHHWNGKVDRQWQRKVINHLFSMQLRQAGAGTFIMAARRR